MMQETLVGSYNYNVLCNILMQGRVLRLNRGAEIGVLTADTSDYLLCALPSLILFCVDPYIEYSEEGADRTQPTMSQLELIARQKLARHGARAQIMKMTSVQAAPHIPDSSLDFVFIDALHEYDAVKQDISAWYPKIRPDGLLSGHDYRWPGVGAAVNEFAAEQELQGFYTPPSSDVWFFAKPS